MTVTGHTAPTLTVHRPDQPGSTIVVTLKAHQAVYAREGYVLAGASAAGSDVATLQAQVAQLQAQLAAQPPAASSSTPTPAATPAPRAPRKRAPRKAAAPALATGPADIGSTSPLDTDPALAGTPKETSP